MNEKVDSVNGAASSNESVDISTKYETPAPQPLDSFADLKARIRTHYELASHYYRSLWGEHIHHGYFLEPGDTKERAQERLIELLLERSDLSRESLVLDVGCGIGGTSRYLARERGCTVSGITISGQQVELAEKEMTCGENGISRDAQGHDFTPYPSDHPSGAVRFIELDAEEMGNYFTTAPNTSKFDCVWISEAMSHLPNKKLFFENAYKLLNPGGKLVVADWFKAEGLTDAQEKADIKPIEDGMLLPPLCTQEDYCEFADKAGFEIFSPPFDISDNVSKTWDISWSLIQNPTLWAFAFSQGRDGIAFLQAFRAMRRGFANGSFRYAVMAFQKP